MTTMRIIRIEKNGYGPLTIGLMDRAVNALTHKACETGEWAENMNVPMDYCYGCKNMEDLYKWFPKPILEELLTLGFAIVEYNVVDFVASFTEVAYDKSTAVLINPNKEV